MLADALANGLGFSKEKITFYPVSEPPASSEGEKILIAEKALITIVVSGADKAEIEKHIDMITCVISTNSKVKESEIEIVQKLNTNSCLLVIRLPGLGAVHLIIVVLSSEGRLKFLQEFAQALPRSALEIRFGFASLPCFSAALLALSSHPDHNVFRHRQTGKF